MPLAWLAIVTTTAAWQKIFQCDVRIGFIAAANDLAAKLAAGVLAPERAAVAPQLIFNQRLEAVLTVLFTAILWLIILDMVRISVRRLRGHAVPASSEAPYQATRLETVILGAAS